MNTLTPERLEKHRLERQAILRAAYSQLGRNTGSTTSVLDILGVAELSTRAFYRHFDSKDELILTMFRIASERVSSELAALIADASDPADAIRRWVRQQLAVVYEPRRARQAVVLTSPEVAATVGFERVNQEAAEDRRVMLAAVIRAGVESGQFPNAENPDEDARAVINVIGGFIAAGIAGRPIPTWEAATDHTTNLFLRAFGAA
jgi:AcrR family transcriptional regulator